MRVNVVALRTHGIIAQAPRLDHIGVGIQAFQLRSRARVNLCACQSLFMKATVHYPAPSHGLTTYPIVRSTIRRIVSLIGNVRYIAKEDNRSDTGRWRGSWRGEARGVLVGAAGGAAGLAAEDVAQNLGALRVA